MPTFGEKFKVSRPLISVRTTTKREFNFSVPHNLEKKNKQGKSKNLKKQVSKKNVENPPPKSLKQNEFLVPFSKTSKRSASILKDANLKSSSEDASSASHTPLFTVKRKPSALRLLDKFEESPKAINEEDSNISNGAFTLSNQPRKSSGAITAPNKENSPVSTASKPNVPSSKTSDSGEVDGEDTNINDEAFTLSNQPRKSLGVTAALNKENDFASTASKPNFINVTPSETSDSGEVDEEDPNINDEAFTLSNQPRKLPGASAAPNQESGSASTASKPNFTNVTPSETSDSEEVLQDGAIIQVSTALSPNETDESILVQTNRVRKDVSGKLDIFEIEFISPVVSRDNEAQTSVLGKGSRSHKRKAYKDACVPARPREPSPIPEVNMDELLLKVQNCFFPIPEAKRDSHNKEIVSLAELVVKNSFDDAIGPCPKRPRIQRKKPLASDDTDNMLDSVFMYQTDDMPSRSITNVTDLEVGLTVLMKSFSEFKKLLDTYEMRELLKRYEDAAINDITQTIRKIVLLQNKLSAIRKVKYRISINSSKLGKLTDDRLKRGLQV